jgi:hypothetical protein
MRVRRELRSPWVVAPIVIALLAVVLTSHAAAVARPEIVFTRVGDKFAVIGWGMQNPSVEESFADGDFGGYRLWMREVWKHPVDDPENFSLVREYRIGDDGLPQDINGADNNWNPLEDFYYDEEEVCVEWGTTPSGEDTCFTWRQGVRRDSAEMFQNAFPYQFSVSAISASAPQAINLEHIRLNKTDIVYPRVGLQNNLESVRCIPNPYRASADWEYGGQRRVSFIGLPEKATIRIYTVAADHVRTLEHNDDDSDLEFWDLKNSDGEEVAPGVYIYLVEAPGMGSKESKVMIIK